MARSSPRSKDGAQAVPPVKRSPERPATKGSPPRFKLRVLAREVSEASAASTGRATSNGGVTPPASDQGALCTPQPSRKAAGGNTTPQGTHLSGGTASCSRPISNGQPSGGNGVGVTGVLSPLTPLGGLDLSQPQSPGGAAMFAELCKDDQEETVEQEGKDQEDQTDEESNHEKDGRNKKDKKNREGNKDHSEGSEGSVQTVSAPEMALVPWSSCPAPKDSKFRWEEARDYNFVAELSAVGISLAGKTPGEVLQALLDLPVSPVSSWLGGVAQDVPSEIDLEGALAMGRSIVKSHPGDAQVKLEKRSFIAAVYSIVITLKWCNRKRQAGSCQIDPVRGDKFDSVRVFRSVLAWRCALLVSHHMVDQTGKPQVDCNNYEDGAGLGNIIKCFVRQRILS